MSDATGNLPFFVVTAAIGAVVGGVVVAKNGGNVWAGIGIGALIGTGVGAAYIANNLQQAGTQITNTVATTKQKIISETPSNPGKPFESGKVGFQY